MSQVTRTGRWLLAGALCVTSTTGCKSGGGIPIWNPFASKPASTSSLAQGRDGAYTQPGAPKTGPDDSWTAPFKKIGDAVSSPFKTPPASTTAPKKSTTSEDSISLTSKTTPPNANLYVSLAKLQERSGNIAAAVEEYDKALDADPKHLPALLGLAHLFDRQGRYEDALALYGKAVASHPDDAAAQNDYGLCLARSKKMSESAAALRRAVALDPEKVLFRNNLATVLVELDKSDEAYQTLVVAHGESIAHYNVGFLLNKRNRKAEALRHFEMASELDPNFKEAKQWVALLGGTKIAEAPKAPATRAEALPLSTPIATPVPAETPVTTTRPATVPTQPTVKSPYPSTAEPQVVTEANSVPVSPLPTPLPQHEAAAPPVTTPTVQPISRPTVVEPTPTTEEAVGPRLLGNEQARRTPDTTVHKYPVATSTNPLPRTTTVNGGPIPPLPEQVSTIAPTPVAKAPPVAAHPASPQPNSTDSEATTAAKFAPSRY